MNIFIAGLNYNMSEAEHLENYLQSMVKLFLLRL